MDSSGAGVGWCIVAASGGAGSCLLTPAATGHVTLRAWVDGAVDPPDPYGLSDDDVNNVSMQVDVVEPSQATQTVTAPPSARPGQQLPLSGAGWKGDTTVTVTLYDPANGEAARSRVTTEADGGFPADATVTVPRDASGGQYLIVAEDQASYLARSPLLVGGTAVNDRVVLSSPTVDAGGDVTVTGRGWPAKTPVTVALYGPGGAQVAQVPITTDADGNLPPGVTLTVPVGSSTGLYSVQATTGDETSDPVPLAVNGPLAQQVSFGDGDGAVPGSAVQYGGTFTPAATSDTGLPVVISVAGACRRDASSGVVTMTAGSGTCTVTASQAGNDYYRAAQIGMSVVAATATQTIAFDPPDSGTVGTSADLSAVAAASSGLPVTITVDTTRSSPSDACAVAGAIATFTHAGTCVLDVDQSGNDDYAAADTVSAVVTVVGSAPTSTTVTTTTAPTSTSAPTTTTGPAGTTAPTTTTATTTPMTTSTAPTTASTVPTTPSATTSTPRRSATTSLSAGSSVNWPPAVPSPDTPVVAWVMSPNPGTVTFTRTDLVMLPPGYVPVGDSYVITAPAATAIDPLHLRFSVLDTGIPTGADRTTLTVFRDGHAAIACAATRSTEADPDPCVSSVRSSDGVTTLTVLARHASTWSVGVRMRTPSTGAGPDRTSLSTGGLGAGPSSAASGTTDDGVAGEAGGSRTVRAYDEGLASTGFPVGVTLVVGAVLLLLGLGLAAAAPRRRRPAH